MTFPETYDSGPDRQAAASALAAVEVQTAAVRARALTSPALLSVIWGIIWFVGFGVAFLAYGPSRAIPAVFGQVVPSVLIIGGMVVSMAYSRRVNRGIDGPSRRTGQLYGWSWTVGFLALALVNRAVAVGLSPEHITLLWSASSLGLVGVLLLVGSALWHDPALLRIGVWMLFSAAGSIFPGVPGNFLVLSLAGGGGFLGLALLQWMRERLAERRTA